MRYVVLLLALSGCIDVRFPSNGEPVSVKPVGSWSDLELLDLYRAAALWDDVGVGFRINDPKAHYEIPIHYSSIPSYVQGSGTAAGVYLLDVGEIYVDPKYVGVNNGLFQTAAHELGHSIGMQHLPEGKHGIMQPSVSSATALSEDDLLEFEALPR